MLSTPKGEFPSPLRKCAYCTKTLYKSQKPTSGEYSYTKDHVFPKKNGGTLLVPCCRKCNQDKRDYTPYEWLAYLIENEDYRLPHVIRTFNSLEGIFHSTLSVRAVKQFYMQDRIKGIGMQLEKKWGCKEKEMNNGH